jgi:ABC-2 type transport system permease protein
MNFFNTFFLRIVLLPAGLYRRMGVNIPHLKAILTTKLMMDDRRVSGLQQTRKKKIKKEPKNTTIASMIFTAIMGSVFLFAFSVGKDYVTQLTVYFSFYIFTLISVLISDFTSVLIDVRDNLIILPKPINDKTFVLARLLHVVIHITKLVMPMALPATIALGIWEGISGFLPFIFLVIAATLFTIFLVNAIYLLILKITTPERFKSIISYFQIFFAIFFYAGYQLVPKLINKAVISGYSIASFKYAFLAVPYWFAASWQYLQGLQWNSPLAFYFLLTLLLPVISVWVVIKYFAPSFNRKLSMIGGSEMESIPVQQKGKKIVSTTSAYITVIGKLLTEKGTERMSFFNTWKITGRSRDFKMKVYPSIGYIAVYIVLLFVNNGKLSLDNMHNQTGPGKFIFMTVIYFSSFAIMMAIYQLAYSDKYKAAWIYYITPIQSPGKLLSGALKSAMVKLYLPMVVLTCIAAIIIAGPAVIPNLMLGIFNQILIITFVGYLALRELPFSTQQAANVKGSGFIRGALSMILPMALGVVHFFVYQYTIVIIILCILSIIASWLMMDALKNKGWEKLQVKEYES